MFRLPFSLFVGMVIAAMAVSGVSAGDKRVGFQNLGTVASKDRASVYVDPVKLTNVYDKMGTSLNFGAIVSDDSLAAGAQKSADVWGVNLDLFVTSKQAERKQLLRQLIENVDQVILIDRLPDEDISPLLIQAAKLGIKIEVLDGKGFDKGFEAISAARADVVGSIPKYDEILPIAFPISPLPDTFFQPSKFPYPRPLIRVERTSESMSASVHAHTSCNMVAQTGNMLHRTSGQDPNLFLMGMEGGNLSLSALPGAVDPEKISAVMTSWVLALRGTTTSQRDILVENDGVGTSFFKPGIHAPEELDLALAEWVKINKITGFRRPDAETVILEGYFGETRSFRGGMFLIAFEQPLEFPRLEEGVDVFGHRTIEFSSTQNFVQLLGEVPNAANVTKSDQNTASGKSPGEFLATVQSPSGGELTQGGGSVGNTVGSPLGALLQRVPQSDHSYQPYILSLEGGFMVVTPEVELSPNDLKAAVARVDLDLRGPLTSDQSIVVSLDQGKQLMFRRTVLNFDELDAALNTLRAQGLIGNWSYEGVRGRGLNANVVIENFLGKHRKFMSSLMTWPGGEHPAQPVVRMYVDGMQRLNFAFLSPTGWRQEFVEVPLKVPPVPRDVALFSDVGKFE
ncbi:hypothetical protein B5K05_33235 [Rhizobium phaseoli]|uniref:hypothetical protein n=1 Tax=Rhizobium phaseoli TaxID=396 RepID=UPI000E0D4235|nr:hypothetical protein [Rhizobium phaseoli]RDJ00737.1 hypothetical protein B5K05_33235 [Rhizobium phaseoli]RDJ00937.1 hypothetical protein B5K04_31320 [Rhizobium phaseoli]